MKTPIKTLALLTGAALFSLSTLTAVETDPVGYITINLLGAATPKVNLINAGGLLQPASSTTAVTVSAGTTVTASGNIWEVDDFAGSHYVQISSTGEWAAILSNTESTLTLDPSTPLVDGADLAAIIRPLNTLDSLFGSNNSAGFTGGSNLGVSDFMSIWDQENQNLPEAYYYNNVANEWRKASTNTAAGSTTIIYPDETLVVFAKSDKPVVISGSVQAGATSGLLVGNSDTAMIPNPYPVDLKISAAGFESFLTGGSSFGPADKVFIWSPAISGFSEGYYFNNSTGPGEWRKASNNQAVSDSDVIPVGSSAVVIRSGSDSSWAVLQTY